MESPDTLNDHPPTPQELAPLAGLVNGEISKLNQSVIGDSSGLRTNKITPETLTGKQGNSPQVKRTPLPAGPIQAMDSNISSAPAQPVVPNAPVVTFDVLKFEKLLEKNTKSINTLKRKNTELAKEIKTLKNIISFDSRRGKFTLATDNISCDCNNTDALINVLLKELQSGCKSITINIG